MPLNKAYTALAFCRAGFEKEVAAELNDVFSANGYYGYAKVYQSRGCVEFIFNQLSSVKSLLKKVRFLDFVFVRSWIVTLGQVCDLDPQDRVSALNQALVDLLFETDVTSVSGIFASNMDTNEGKSLLKLCKAIVGHLQQNIEVDKSSSMQLELAFTSGTSAYLGLSGTVNCSHWHQGIPRLRLPKEAPSRATLKLEEAWHHFIPASEWDKRLAPSMRAVDLGAAPGGWTWQLVRRSMFVDAVDNGPMDSSLMESGQVHHHQCDGFSYRPAKAVDWVVCDIADKPARVAAMIAFWGAQRWFSEAIFNLKLPMKQRYKELQKCKQLIADVLQDAGVPFELAFKQLYHDREEVTGHLCLISSPAP